MELSAQSRLNTFSQNLIKAQKGIGHEILPTGNLLDHNDYYNNYIFKAILQMNSR